MEMDDFFKMFDKKIKKNFKIQIFQIDFFFKFINKYTYLLKITITLQNKFIYE